MTIDEALISVMELYEKGVENSDVIRNPVAWALYHVWEEAEYGTKDKPVELAVIERAREKAMTDRERFVNDFEHKFNKAVSNWKNEVYLSTDEARNILQLVRAQKTKPRYNGDDAYACESCGEIVGLTELGSCGLYDVRHNYCPKCGKLVIWNA